MQPEQKKMSGAFLGILKKSTLNRESTGQKVEIQSV